MLFAVLAHPSACVLLGELELNCIQAIASVHYLTDRHYAGALHCSVSRISWVYSVSSPALTFYHPFILARFDHSASTTTPFLFSPHRSRSTSWLRSHTPPLSAV